MSQVISLKARNWHRENTLDVRAMAHQTDVNDLVAGVQGREYKTFDRLAGRNRVQPDGMALKVGIHLAVGPPHVDHSDWQHEKQRQEHPNQEAEGPQAMAAGEVIGRGGLVRRIVIRVDIEKTQAVGRTASIGDSQPDRLNAAPRHVDAEEALAFLGIQHRHGYVNVATSLSFGALKKASIVLCRLVAHEQPIQDWDSGDCHGR
jgi:hypothetical protein